MINYNTYNSQYLSVSFKPTYIDFTPVIDMLALSAVLILSIVNPFKCFMIMIALRLYG